MKIGLKYCGGCNPNYERSSIVKRAREEYPCVTFEPFQPEANYDVVLVICGCLEECFAFSCCNSVHGTIAIRDPEEYERFTSFMELYDDGETPSPREHTIHRKGEYL